MNTNIQACDSYTWMGHILHLEHILIYIQICIVSLHILNLTINNSTNGNSFITSVIHSWDD